LSVIQDDIGTFCARAVVLCLIHRNANIVLSPAASPSLAQAGYLNSLGSSKTITGIFENTSSATKRFPGKEGEEFHYICYK
jgi:hypothetical protein